MTLTLLAGCEIKIKPNSDDCDGGQPVEVQRYDRLESRYLTTGDFSALQQMNIDYPMETRTLVEDVLQLGEVNDPDINNKFLRFYQDTVLQALIADVEVQYASMNDVNKQFRNAFKQLGKLIPGVRVPVVYSLEEILYPATTQHDAAQVYCARCYGVLYPQPLSS